MGREAQNDHTTKEGIVPTWLKDGDENHGRRNQQTATGKVNDPHINQGRKTHKTQSKKMLKQKTPLFAIKANNSTSFIFKYIIFYCDNFDLSIKDCFVFQTKF